MTDACPTDLTGFRQLLQRQGADYLHVEPPQDCHAHIRFVGTFEHEPVIWDATVMTLASAAAALPHAAAAVESRQFIVIGDRLDDMRRLDVGLALDRIDEPALLKTIIMIRKYKRLRRGRHAFGGT
ncbi:MAG: hypothetical protein R3308_02760 [Thiohalobacterales bacterium]|nr:hypothetical protein [Thiohalobacterales bacterium]